MEEIEETVIHNVSSETLNLGDDEVQSISCGDETKFLRKCLRKGDRICYSDLQNIKIFKKLPEKEPSALLPEDELFEKLDSYRSGESVFKTFTFEQTKDIDDPETQKCIEFWKSVMEKNLAPIKCALIECESRRGDRCEKPSDVQIEKEESVDLKAKVQPPSIWATAVRNIKRHKLNKLKLLVKERCDYCTDPFDKEEEPSLFTDDDLQEIKNLNDWTPSEPTEPTEKEGKKTTKQSKRPKKDLQEKPQSTKRKSSSAAKTRSAHAKSLVPVPKCPCNSEVCICQPKRGKKMDVNLAKKGIEKDDSTDSIAHADTCTCGVPEAPWMGSICTSTVCPGRKISLTDAVSEKLIPSKKTHKQSAKPSIDVNAPCVCTIADDAICTIKECIHKGKASGKSSSPCVCATTEDAVCKVKECVHKHITLIKDDSTCVCGDEVLEIICKTDVCEVKPPAGKSPECKCGRPYPWVEITCDSPICPNKKKPKPLKAYPKDQLFPAVASTCVCGSPYPWLNITCPSPECAKTSPTIETTTTADGHPCICGNTAAWNEAVCPSEVCPTKPKVESEECICGDGQPLDVTCLTDTCAQKIDPTCICADSTEDVICRVDVCPVKTKTDCVCQTVESATDVICLTKECFMNQPNRPLLEPVRKTSYDTSCVCKMHGMPMNVTCAAKECPYKTIRTKKNAVQPPVYTTLPADAGYPIGDSGSTCVCARDDLSLQVSCKALECKEREIGIDEFTCGIMEPVKEYPECLCKDPTLNVECLTGVCPTKMGTTGDTTDTCICEEPHVICTAPDCLKNITDLSADLEAAGTNALESCICDKPTFSKEVICTVPECPTNVMSNNNADVDEVCVCTPNTDLDICEQKVCPKKAHNLPKTSTIQIEEYMSKCNNKCLICGNKDCKKKLRKK